MMGNHQGIPFMMNLIVLIAWSLYFITTSDACSCVYSHPQEHFCSSDFVVTLSIQGDPKQLHQYNYLRYPVKVYKIYKGMDKTSVRKGFIYTGSALSSCSPTLAKNTTYLMTGRIVNGKPFVSICNFISEWSSLTYRQKKGFRRNFGRSCGCKVTDAGSYAFYSGYHYNFSNRSIDGQTDNTKGYRRFGYCSWDTKWEIEFDCQGSYSTCLPVPAPSSIYPEPESNDVINFDSNRNRRNRSKLGQCQWDQNIDYLDCMKRKAERKALLQLEREGEP